ncbi:hypothetical protein GDO81_012903 [Engystomops pustulosus]|uniref:RRM domain-containing protein n=1 Tax=Engystomops pustulosus TaxID=76066 RepID=A0AAV7B2L7_ENGPU|nr:hypothetical protein GDO81_012903 [Engystomops pustulosus]
MIWSGPFLFTVTIIHFPALTMFRHYGFVQFERKEDADAAVEGERGRMYKEKRLDINKAADRRNMFKPPAKPSPARRDVYGYGESQEPRRDRSPLRSSPRRDGREPRERESRTLRDGREPRDARDPKDFRDSRDGDLRDGHGSRDLRDARDTRDVRDPRDARDPRDVRDHRDARDPRDVRDHRDARDPRDSRDAREPRDYRDPRDAKDLRDARDLRLREPRDARDVRDPPQDRYRDARDTRRVDEPFDYQRKREEYYDRYRDSADRPSEDRYKREERRREDLYRQYFDDIQRKLDEDRPVDCSVVVANKQSKEYAESVGRKVRDLGMLVDLIFLNTEVSLSQVLEDVTRGGTPFAIVISQQHQTHRSCTVNILFGTPQEHRNMPLADAMVLIARSFERYKVEKREKEREDIARQAAKLSTDAILRERAITLDEGIRAPPPPAIMALLNLLADNRYVTPDEIDKVILYLRDRRERILAVSGDTLTSQLSRPLGGNSGPSLEGSSTLASSQTVPMAPQLASSAPPTQAQNNQELQLKILSLFNNSASTSSTSSVNPPSSGVTNAQGQSYGNVAPAQRSVAQMDIPSLGPSSQRPQSIVNQHPGSVTQSEASRSVASRSVQPPQMQNFYGHVRPQTGGNVPNQRPGASAGINFDNPSVQKALDSLIQSGPALSHLVSQTAGQGIRSGPQQPSSMGSYPRHY